GTIPPKTTPHIPGTSASTSETITWQVEVPIIATICPGATALAAAAVTCASTLPTATQMPSGNPVHSAAMAESFPALSPNCAKGCSTLSVTKSLKSGLSAAKKSGEG